VLMCWCVDVLMCWCVDVLMCWCVDVLMCWCVDVLMCWCVDVSTRKNRYSIFGPVALDFRGRKIRLWLVWHNFRLAFEKKKFHVTNSPSGVCTWWKVSPTKTPSSPVGTVRVDKNWQKVVEMTALARGVRIRCLFWDLRTLSKVIWKKTDFPKYFKPPIFQMTISLSEIDIFQKKLGFDLFRSARISEKNRNPKKNEC